MASSSSSEPDPLPPVPRPPPWVALARVALVPPRAVGDMSLSLLDPPRISRYFLPTNLHPDPDCADKEPYVVAANAAGLVVHVSGNPKLDSRSWDVLLVAPAHGFRPADPAADRDVPTCTPVRLPDRAPEQVRISSIRTIGLLPLPDGDYVVAELVVGPSCAALLTFRSGEGDWVESALTVPPVTAAYGATRWTPHDVVHHAGNLWWIDLARGLLFCNPVADDPPLRFVELPATIDLQLRAEPREHIEFYRIVSETGGRLRFVDVAQSSRAATPGDTEVVVWTLTVDVRSGAASWKHGERVTTTMANIWAGENFRRSGIPEIVPAPVLVHPAKPDVVYFYQPQFLYGVDVRRGELLKAVKSDGGPRPTITSRRALAWVVPPSLLNVILPGDEHHSSEECQSSEPSSDLTDKKENTLSNPFQGRVVSHVG
ncbi:hypothetical protein ACP4OV_030508 [Aristida adscensionis]